MTKTINPEFRTKVDRLLDELIVKTYENAPIARYLLSSSQVDKELFIRHTFETILRIRLARIADSKAINLFTKSDPVAAQKWAKYMEEEMLHDRLFLKDLHNMGVEDEASVYETEPFLATKLLQGYLYYTLDTEGPRGLICKSYFVEYTTRKTQMQWNDNIQKSLGEKAVKGAVAHANDDVDEDHSTDVWNVLMSMVSSPEEEARVLYHLNVYYGLFCAYFTELASTTRGKVAELGEVTKDTVAAAVQGVTTPPAA